MVPPYFAGKCWIHGSTHKNNENIPDTEHYIKVDSSVAEAWVQLIPLLHTYNVDINNEIRYWQEKLYSSLRRLTTTVHAKAYSLF